MKIYLAGTSVSNPAEELKMQGLFKKSGHKLHSYFHKDALEKNWLPITMKNRIDLFLDSGAFSAWTQKITINIDEYIDFIKENQEFITVYANLDVIGIGGKQPNKLTAAATLKNQKYMESKGLKPMPCFHIGEPWKYLEYYVDNYEFLALGVAGNSGVKLIPWLDECFSKHICDENGLPKIKVHGFAVTSLPLMLRYPWYSVDSTSWVVTGRMGGFYMPVKRNEQWCYDENSWKISVSNKSPNRKEAGQHFDTMSPMNQKMVLEYLNLKGYKIGKSEYKMEAQNYELKEGEKWAEKKPINKNVKRQVEIIVEPGISNMYQLRDELNIIYFTELEKSIQPYPWAFKLNTNSLF